MLLWIFVLTSLLWPTTSSPLLRNFEKSAIEIIPTVSSDRVALNFLTDNPNPLANDSYAFNLLSKRAWRQFPNGPTIDYTQAGPVRAGDFPDENAYSRVAAAVVDVRFLVLAALEAIGSSSSSFLRYFRSIDGCTVRNIFTTILGPDGNGSPILKDYTIYYNLCPEDGFEDADACDDGQTSGWTPDPLDSTEADPLIERGAVVLCPLLFNRRWGRSLKDISCADIGDYASYRSMDALSFTLFHEYLHWDDKFKPLAGQPIIDWNTDRYGNILDRNAVPVSGYGPHHCAVLNQQAAVVPTLNADNYIWFAAG